MFLRKVQVFVPKSHEAAARACVEEFEPNYAWCDRLSRNLSLVSALLPASQTEGLLDALERKFAGVEKFRVILVPVEASLPREPAETKKESSGKIDPVPVAAPRIERVSRAELYADVEATTKLSRNYLIFVGLSAVVAVIGLLRDSIAIVIGAMVIAPLLGPNVGLSLATTLADFPLARRSVKTLLGGLGAAVAIAAALAMATRVDPSIAEIASRTEVNYSDIILAFVAGAAATLSFTTAASETLIGVMVAVAMLPPAVVLGLMIGSGNAKDAYGALLLLLTNVICVNLAGVLTFLVQGVRPRMWWEATKARRATRKALILWCMLLAALLLLIYLSRQADVGP